MKQWTMKIYAVSYYSIQSSSITALMLGYICITWLPFIKAGLWRSENFPCIFLTPFWTWCSVSSILLLESLSTERPFHPFSHTFTDLMLPFQLCLLHFSFPLLFFLNVRCELSLQLQPHPPISTTKNALWGPVGHIPPGLGPARLTVTSKKTIIT